MKKGFKIIELELFPYDIAIANQISVSEIKNKLSRFGIVTDKTIDDYLHNNALANTVKLPNKSVLIYFKEPPTQGTIAHEAFHAVWMVLATMDVEPSVDSEEVYAYMLDYVVGKINE